MFFTYPRRELRRRTRQAVVIAPCLSCWAWPWAWACLSDEEGFDM